MLHYISASLFAFISSSSGANYLDKLIYCCIVFVSFLRFRFFDFRRELAEQADC